MLLFRRYLLRIQQLKSYILMLKEGEAAAGVALEGSRASGRKNLEKKKKKP
jgi:hypothetical protein